jgi:hypothetical protein
MRTALFVYEPSSINIATAESDVELSSLDAGSVTLACGSNARSLARGIYKIVSNRDVTVSGDLTAIDIVVTTQNKDNDPTPPSRAVALVAPIDADALHAFFAVPEAKSVATP